MALYRVENLSSGFLSYYPAVSPEEALEAMCKTGGGRPEYEGEARSDHAAGLRTYLVDDAKAYEIMHEWDREAGIEPRSDADLDADIPGCSLPCDYDEWKARLADGDVAAILAGRGVWGLPAFV